jgi:NADPH:quinone reductase-like Zn-dependent oxidoreductase
MIRASVMLAAWLLAGASAYAASPELPTTTRKVVLEKVESGGFRWKLTEAKVPILGEHQVLVHVRAVALNRGDLEMLDPGPRDYSGRVVASDAAGDVVAIGAKVKGFRPGMRVTNTFFRNYVDGPFSREKLSAVFGSSIDGVLADYIVLDDTAIAAAPESLSYEEAATLPTAGLTGWMATLGHTPLRAGHVVLVQGTGGVSVLAAQLSSAAGARVIVTSSSDDKLARMKSFGASDGINYRKAPAWSEEVMRHTEKHGADVIVDVGGKDTLAESVKSLAYGGTIAIVGGLTGYDGSIPAGPLLSKTARAQGVYVGSRADLQRMNAFIQKHRVKPLVDKVFPIEQFDDAVKLMASGNFVGKIVLKL